MNYDDMNINNEHNGAIRYLILMAIKNFLRIDVISLKHDVLQFEFNNTDAEEIADEVIFRYSKQTKMCRSSIDGTLKMLGRTTFFEEYDCRDMFNGIEVPASLINRFMNGK